MTQKRRRWLDQLAKSLEEQGCRVRPGKRSLYVVYPPKGGMFSIHYSPEDWRTMKNLRAVVRQHGLEWPFSDTPTY